MDTKSKSTAGLNFASDGNFHWAGATYRSLGGAGTYNPRVPVLVGTGNKSRAEDDIAWADQPKWSALRTRLANKDQRIDRDTIRTNAEMLLRLFEQDVVKHVARTQADTKIMKALLCRDKAEELRDPAKYREVAGARLARSSYLGRDPFGDQPVPDECTYEDTEGEEQYDQYGSLLVSVQDACYRYARVHLRRIVSESIWTRIAKQEHYYKRNPSGLESHHNKRMPWKEYCDLVLRHLPTPTGMSTLNFLLTFPGQAGWDILECGQLCGTRGHRRPAR